MPKVSSVLSPGIFRKSHRDVKMCLVTPILTEEEQNEDDMQGGIDKKRRVTDL